MGWWAWGPMTRGNGDNKLVWQPEKLLHSWLTHIYVVIMQLGTLTRNSSSSSCAVFQNTSTGGRKPLRFLCFHDCHHEGFFSALCLIYTGVHLNLYMRCFIFLWLALITVTLEVGKLYCQQDILATTKDCRRRQNIKKDTVGIAEEGL